MSYIEEAADLVERVQAMAAANEELRENLLEVEAEREGLLRLISGEQIGVSTSIADTTTYGYGDLDFYGFWEYPVPEDVVKQFQETWKRS